MKSSNEGTEDIQPKMYYDMISHMIFDEFIEIKRKHKNELIIMLNDLINERDRRNKNLDDQIKEVRQGDEELYEDKEFLIEGLEMEKIRFDKRINELEYEIDKCEIDMKLWSSLNDVYH